MNSVAYMQNLSYQQAWTRPPIYPFFSKRKSINNHTNCHENIPFMLPPRSKAWAFKRQPAMAPNMCNYHRDYNRMFYSPPMIRRILRENQHRRDQLVTEYWSVTQRFLSDRKEYEVCMLKACWASFGFLTEVFDAIARTREALASGGTRTEMKPRCTKSTGKSGG